ncbi:MAG: T9SS type B sorting domain-containing protein, partial [Flavobacterium sp.]|nr:T9SS type B sorting domain-containing protein [Flavobacterium sp.]
TSLNNISGTWSPATVNNSAGATYTFTPTTGQCATITTLTTIFTANVTPTFNTIPVFCSGATAPVLPTTSLNNISGTWSPATVNNSAGATYTFTPTTGQCATTATLTTIVTANITPTFNTIPAFCSGATAPVLPTTSLINISGTWSPATVNNLIAGTYTFTPTTGQCATSITLTTIVTAYVTPTFNAIPAFCLGSVAPVLPTTSLNNISGTWSPATVNNSAGATYTFKPTAGQCANNFTITTNIQTPTITTENLSICKDNQGNAIASIVLNSGLNNNDFSFTWTLDNLLINQNTTSISVVVAGNYQLVATSNVSGCQQTFNFNVIALQPITANYIISEDFDLNQSVVVEAFGGSGQYLYSFDNLPFQNNPTFNETNGGDILVKIKDSSTCYEISKTITLWQFPRFFTPNNDGFNDSCTIKTQKKIKIDIFDRFGKLLQQLQTGDSWNGTINSQILPASDYWFVVYYDENKIFRGHFALKR